MFCCMVVVGFLLGKLIDIVDISYWVLAHVML